MRWPLTCPLCREQVAPVELPQTRVVTRGYGDCIRRCEPCGVGFSNSRSGPTTIYREPLKNFPPDVVRGLEQAVGLAVNETARPGKLARMGFDTSEDAVTWTVFSYLAIERPDVLASLGSHLFCLDAANVDAVLLWGSPVPATSAGEVARQRLIEISDRIGENAKRRSEPDVIVDFGAAGVVFVEVKLNARNDFLDLNRRERFERYAKGSACFSDPLQVRATGLYELARNWRIGWELARDRPFRLVNLGREALFRRSADLDAFADCLASTPTRSFERIGWGSFLSAMAEQMGGLPGWMSSWLAMRDLKSM